MGCKKLALLGGGLALVTCLVVPLHAAWTPLGESINYSTSQDASDPCLAMSGSTPYITWCELDGGTSRYNIFVKYWNGSSWVLLDAPRQPLNFSSSLNPIYPRIAVSNSIPYVTWAELAKVYVKACNNGAWAQVGTAELNMNTANAAYSPDIAIDNNTPYVAWHEGSTNYQVFAKYFNGYTWLPVGGTSECLNDDPSTYAGNARIALIQSTPHVVWEEQKGVAHTESIYTKYFNGSSWIYLSGASASLNVETGPENRAFTPAIVISNGTPIIAWRELNLGNRSTIRIKQFTGGQWQRLENEPNGLIIQQPDYMAYYPGLAMADTIPCLVWQERNLVGPERYIQMRWANGSTWQGMGNDPAPLQNNANQGATASCIAAAGGTVYVAWQESDGSHSQIYVKQSLFPATPTPTPTIHITSTPAPSLHHAYAAPNPFVPTRGQKVSFYFSHAANAPYRVRIFNIKGQIVRTLNNEEQWDGRSDFGNLCEGGEYLFQIEAEANPRLSGKVVLIK